MAGCARLRAPLPHDSAIGRVLDAPRRDPGDASAADPGAVEFDTWLVDRH